MLEEYFLPQKVNTEQLTTEVVFNYIKSLNTGIKCWNYINNPEFSSYNAEIKEYLKKLYYQCQEPNIYFSRRNSSSMIKVLLMACLEKNENDSELLKLLKALERYVFFIKFIPLEDSIRGEEYNLNYSEIISKIKNDDLSLIALAEKLNKLCEKMKSTNSIMQNTVKYYSKHGFYGSDFLRYFLCEYEVHLLKISKNHSEKLNRDQFYTENRDSIEHIYPQNARAKYWQQIFEPYNQKQRSALRNSLGNFVAISKPKNSNLGNKPFPDKKGNHQNTVGYMYGTYAEIELSKYKEWSAIEILERGKKLTNFLQQRWDIVLSDNKDDIVEFLGLGFLKNK